MSEHDTPAPGVPIPTGHRRRRVEHIPVLLKKFEVAMRGHLPMHKVKEIIQAACDSAVHGLVHTMNTPFGSKSGEAVYCPTQ